MSEFTRHAFRESFSESSYGEIDLREQLHTILYGSSNFFQKGHWVMYRRFDLNKKSEYYNETTKEGHKGPAYKHVNEIHMCRKIDMSAVNVSELEIVGEMPDFNRFYIFEFNVFPKKGDYIYELNLESHKSQPSLEKAKNSIVDRYKIKKPYDKRSDYGRIEFWMVPVVLDIGSY